MSGSPPTKKSHLESDDGQTGCYEDDIDDVTECREASENSPATLTTAENKPKRPPRSERKRLRAEALKQRHKEERRQKKQERKQRLREMRDTQGTAMLPQRPDREEVRQRLETARTSGQIFCVDCSMEQHMSDKEKSKLAMQIGQMYGVNRRTDSPAHLYLTSLTPGGVLHEELNKKMTGFDTDSCMIDRSEKSHTELFPLDKMVFLTPDSRTALLDVDPGAIYILGGLVDEFIQKNLSHSRAEAAKISTARLPIDEYMVRGESQSYSKVLTINQVFEILLTYKATKDWRQALLTGVPKRKGYVIRSEENT